MHTAGQIVSCTPRVPSLLVLAVLDRSWAVPAVFKLPEQPPTLFLRQIPQIYQHVATLQLSQILVQLDRVQPYV